MKKLYFLLIISLIQSCVSKEKCSQIEESHPFLAISMFPKKHESYLFKSLMTDKIIKLVKVKEDIKGDYEAIGVPSLKYKCSNYHLLDYADSANDLLISQHLLKLTKKSDSLLIRAEYLFESIENHTLKYFYKKFGTSYTDSEQTWEYVDSLLIASSPTKSDSLVLESNGSIVIVKPNEGLVGFQFKGDYYTKLD